jgi:hypothetical protein
VIAVGRWFSPGTQVSSTNKPDHHDIAEILLTVALNNLAFIPVLKPHSQKLYVLRHCINMSIYKKKYIIVINYTAILTLDTFIYI